MKKSIILAGLVVLKFVLQFVLVNGEYDLHRDEYLHLDQGHHLAWGYISVPPVTSWISWLIHALGGGYFWVRFFPALFGALTLILVWKMIDILMGGLFAQFAAALAILASVITRINILYQPNSLDIFFWTLLYFTIVKYVQTGNARWFLATGLAVGFGFLSKYNIAFLVCGLLPAIIIGPERKMLRHRELYFGIGLALLIILPNIIWQVQNDFPTRKQLQELASTQLVNVQRGDFIKEQVLFFLSSLPILLAGFAGFFLHPPFRKYRFIIWSYVIVISTFLFLKAKGYYAIGLYPVLIAFGSVYMEYLLRQDWKRYLRPVLILFILALSIPFFLLAFPIAGPEEIHKNNERYRKVGMLRWEDGKENELPQDFADMTGWREIALLVDSAYKIANDQNGTLVFCDNYGQAGAVNYYSSFKNINAVSFNADYANWIPWEKKVTNVILVKEVKDDDRARTKERPLFDSVILVGKNENRNAREFGTTVWLLKGAKVDVMKLLRRKS